MGGSCLEWCQPLQNVMHPSIISDVTNHCEAGDTCVPTFQLNPEVLIKTFDTCLTGTTYQLVLGDTNFHLNERLRDLLLSCSAPQSADKLYAAIPMRPGGLETPTDVHNFVEHALVRKRILLREPPIPEVPGAIRSRPKGTDGFLVRIPVLPYSIVNPICRRLSWLFGQRASSWMILFIVASHAIFYASVLRWEGVIRHTLVPSQYALLVGLVYGALLCHEFGHASACARFGVKHGPIGFGIYLVWPVLYADVSCSWQLTRQQRMIVDAGGIYFHLLVSSVICWSWIFTGNTLCRLLIHSIALSTIANLNPFLRFDGYWLLTDFVGVPNLRQTALEVAKNALGPVRRRWGRPGPTLMTSTGMGVGKKAIAVLYGVGSVVFSIGFLVYLGFILPARITHDVTAAAKAVSFGSVSHEVKFGLLGTLSTVTLTILTCYRLARTTIKGGHKAYVRAKSLRTEFNGVKQ